MWLDSRRSRPPPTSFVRTAVRQAPACSIADAVRTLLSLGLFIILALATAGCDEQPYRQYASASEAVAAGERDRGWLPVWLPLSARDVHLQGDLDTNQWWLRVQLSRAAADSLRTVLVPVPADSVRAQRPRGSGRWWFEALVQHAPENDHALNAHLFRGTGRPVPRTTIVAFDRLSDRVYVWGGLER
ncbi:MAG: hypothetical protein KY467_10780 [Gemmatimonadetes bacterium]|nr:hypothetical protein [Gemmatimonadota bacterium]